MIKEEAIVETLAISRMGLMVNFQLQLPHDAKRIIGLEYGTTNHVGVPLPSPFRLFEAEEDPLFLVSPNKMIGKISLQNPGCESIFFSENLIEDRNTHLHEEIASILWQPSVWSHSRKREEISLDVGSNVSLIEGFFQDSFGAGEYESLSYNLNLYFWIEKYLSNDNRLCD